MANVGTTIPKERKLASVDTHAKRTLENLFTGITTCASDTKVNIKGQTKDGKEGTAGFETAPTPQEA
jgi:hypothetical protein